MSAASDAFFARLEAVTDQPLSAIETAADLGSATLHNARKRGNVPSLEVVLAVARALHCTPAELLGDATPPELAPPAIRLIPLLRLAPASDLNPRRAFDAHLIDELAASIEAQGLLQNLVVRPGPGTLYTVVAGGRRLRALEQLVRERRLPDGLCTGIPCRVVDATDEEHVVLALLENMQRVDVHPLDEAEALARLHAIDPARWSTRHIAERLGVTQRQVQLRLQLATRLIERAKEAFREGRMKLGEAKAFAAMSEPLQLDAFDEWSEAGGTYDSEGELADAASREMFAWGNAIFDVAASGLQTFEHPHSGETWIVDRAAAIEANRRAADAEAAKHEAAGAEFVDRFAGPVPTKNYVEGGTGVTICFYPGSGRVWIETGLRRASAEEAAEAIGEAYSEAVCGTDEPPPAPPAPALAPLFKAEDIYRTLWVDAKDRLMSAIRNIAAPVMDQPLPAPLIHVAQAIGVKPHPVLLEDRAIFMARIERELAAEAAA